MDIFGIILSYSDSTTVVNLNVQLSSGFFRKVWSFKKFGILYGFMILKVIMILISNRSCHIGSS